MKGVSETIDLGRKIEYLNSTWSEMLFMPAFKDKINWKKMFVFWKYRGCKQFNAHPCHSISDLGYTCKVRHIASAPPAVKTHLILN